MAGPTHRVQRREVPVAGLSPPFLAVPVETPITGESLDPQSTERKGASDASVGVRRCASSSVGTTTESFTSHQASAPPHEEPWPAVQP